MEGFAHSAENFLGDGSGTLLALFKRSHVIDLAEIFAIDTVERTTGQLFLTLIAGETIHVVGVAQRRHSGRVAENLFAAFAAELIAAATSAQLSLHIFDEPVHRMISTLGGVGTLLRLLIDGAVERGGWEWSSFAKHRRLVQI